MSNQSDATLTLATALLKLPDDWGEKQHMGGVIQINPGFLARKRNFGGWGRAIGSVNGLR